MEQKKQIIYIDDNEFRYGQVKSKVGSIYNVQFAQSALDVFLLAEKNKNLVAFLSYGAVEHPNGIQLRQLINSSAQITYVPFILICDQVSQEDVVKCLQNGINDCFTFEFEPDKLKERIDFLTRTLKTGRIDQKSKVYQYKMPLIKRVFDIAVASLILLFISPLLLFIIILIKLDSQGPIFYISKRAGTGFRSFDFYKFRSMSVNADKKLSSIAHLNQYATSKSEKLENKDYDFIYCSDCKVSGTQCKNPLFFDKLIVCEKNYIEGLDDQKESTFIKIKDDPRVTKFGKFLRNSSIDELPQLLNVIKGDMSIVGNRPLPLYEAEKLTSDQFALRFLAPAGITGLWQVTKRGRSGPMSYEERIQLDNDYATNVSFIKDILIILKTIPALLQKENV